MTFQAPTLISWSSTASTTYVTDFNTNMTRITSAFNQIEAELATAFSATANQFGADLSRRVSGSDIDGGAIGAYSLVFVDAGSNLFRLDAANASLISAAVIGGTRYEHSGNFQGDWTDLELSDASYTVYVGVDALAPTDLSLAFSVSESDIQLSLYEVDLTVSGSGTTYTVDSVVRTDRTLLWDNTVEQLRQEMAHPLIFNFDDLAQDDDFRFRMPFDARFAGMWVWVEDNIGASTIEVQDSTGTAAEVYISWSENPAADELIYQAVAAAWDGIVIAAGTEILVDVPVLSSGPTQAAIGIEIIPAYNVPTYP